MPKEDRIGRPQTYMKRMGHGIGFALWMAEHVPPKLVPPQFWILNTDSEGDQVADVSCPCKHMPTVPILGAITPCHPEPVEGCDCERYFFFDGQNVWAFNSPTPTAKESPAEEAATSVEA
jgi:hypothetical protein